MIPVHRMADDATKRKSRLAYTRAVKDGLVVRPDFCFRCGGDGGGKAIQGHHIDYSAPLVVVWLCLKCHQHEHRDDPRPRKPPVHGPTIEPGYVSRKDATRILDVSPYLLKKMVRDGTIQEVRLGGRTVRYSLGDVRDVDSRQSA